MFVKRFPRSDLLYQVYPINTISRKQQYLPTALTREVMRSPPSVRLSVRPSVRLFPLYLRNRLTVDLEFCTWVGHDYSSQGIEGQGHRSRSRSWVRLTRSDRPRSRAVFFLVVDFFADLETSVSYRWWQSLAAVGAWGSFHESSCEQSVG